MIGCGLDEACDFINTTTASLDRIYTLVNGNNKSGAAEHRRRKEALFGGGGGGGQSINIAHAKCARKFLGHTPLIEVQGSRMLQTVQLLSTTKKMDGKRARRSLLEPTLGSR